MLSATALCTSVQYLIAFCSRLAAASDVISVMSVGPIVPDKWLKFVIVAETILEKLHPKLSEAAYSTVFCGNFRPQVISDVISGGTVD